MHWSGPQRYRLRRKSETERTNIIIIIDVTAAETRSINPWTELSVRNSLALWVRKCTYSMRHLIESHTNKKSIVDLKGIILYGYVTVL